MISMFFGINYGRAHLSWRRKSFVKSAFSGSLGQMHKPGDRAAIINWFKNVEKTRCSCHNPTTNKFAEWFHGKFFIAHLFWQCYSLFGWGALYVDLVVFLLSCQYYSNFVKNCGRGLSVRTISSYKCA